ncbi:MAG: hypothetical protein O3A95_01935 [Planctomycetota bacterium]|nr:hypothetical protein [Planctomycetota bacterium]MDA1113044.1 hypothetical protein [Planctomycetota bacterium]
MSRILIALIALLGLGLGSCSSSPSAHGLGVNPDIDTSTYDPRPRGMDGAGSAFDKYWMGHNAASPYAGSETSNSWYHFLTPWNWGGGENFGDTTERSYRPYANRIDRPNAFEMFRKWALNSDVDDPYHD